ncbi:hypothetical protein WJX73_004839 [Symbiochloris irregularis]|uniref:Uncharacterized protein n=1 Tax=Symbiochloris irregularis TaxID=706552 RepID=A0AAW1NZ37_9CHLO
MDFLLNVDSMCLFIQNQNFQAHTEHMMNALYDGAREANAALAMINPALEKHHSQLQGECALVERLILAFP